MKKKKATEDKFKKIYQIENEDQLVFEFKDEIGVSEDGKKKTIKGRGQLCNELSGFIFQYLESYHIHTHFIKQLSEKEMLVKNIEMIPIEVFVRNVAAGNLVKQFNVEEGKELECPITEYYLKDDEGNESMINLDHIVSFGHATTDEMQAIQRIASKANAILKDYFRRRGLRLVDIGLEFGRYKNKLLLGDEISPNNCRIWDLLTGAKYDYDILSQDIKDAGEKYQELRNHIFT